MKWVAPSCRRISMKPPPPRLPACGCTTASAKPVATAASIALPPSFMISTPAAEANALLLATMPCCACTGANSPPAGSRGAASACRAGATAMRISRARTGDRAFICTPCRIEYGTASRAMPEPRGLWKYRASRLFDVRALAVLREIEPLALMVLADAQADGRLQHLQDDVGPDRAPDRRGGNRQDLDSYLARESHSRGIPHAPELRRDEDAGQRRAENAADSVHRGDIERVIHMELALEELGRRETDQARRGADCDGAERSDESGGRCDRPEPRHHAGNDAEHARLAEPQPLRGHPSERAGGGAQVRDENGHRGRAVGRKRAAAVEAEPADPEHAGAQDGERHVVRRHGSVRKALALAQHQCGDERTRSGRHVHDDAACK